MDDIENRDDTAHRSPPIGPGLRGLSGDDTGRFSVRTLTGGYVLDLTARRLARYPVTATAGTTSVTLTFDVDGLWLPLVDLAHCAVGDRMRATVLIEDVEQPLHSSAVQSIHPDVHPVDDGTAARAGVTSACSSRSETSAGSKTGPRSRDRV